MKHVIIDTDPGVDDALALMLALSSPELAVEAVTTVFGNVSLEKTHSNALRILEFLGVTDITVSRGASKPLLGQYQERNGFHGESGLGEAVLPEPTLMSSPDTAVKTIIQKADELGKELTICAVGPLTNIASALIYEPELAYKVNKLVIMGGAFHLTPYGHGNTTPVAEFNIWSDPESAKLVFESGIPVEAYGLDVTTDPANKLTGDTLRRIADSNTRKSRLVSDLCSRYIQRSGSFSLHDPMAVASIIDPSLGKTQKLRIDVETSGDITRGQTVVEHRASRFQPGRGPNVDVCISMDGPRLLDLFNKRIV